MRYEPWCSSPTASLTVLVLLFISSLIGTQGTQTPVSPRNLDLPSLGRVALVGDFDSISIRDYEEEVGRSITNGSQSILLPLPNGAFADISAADANINAMCPFVMKDGALAGIVVGGNFTSLGGVDAQAIALLDPNTEQVTPLPGVLGTVNAVLCDQETNSVYMGGSFQAANSTNAIAWVGMTGWADLPFSGFDGPVTSITKAPDGHIIFGGSFSGLGNTTTPTTRDAQFVNLQTAEISASDSEKSSNPRNIICPTNGTNSQAWLLPDDTPGYWRASTEFGYEPTLLRLYNTGEGRKGTKEFRLTAEPINGIMNFTYQDPETGLEAACDAACPLAQSSSLPYQDFRFVDLVGMNAFQVDISDWYGSGGGLAGIELFQDDIFVHAVNDYNDPVCADADYPSSSSVKGDWEASRVDSQYLVADASGPNSPSITFEPNIKQSGNYSVLIYTPGCLLDLSCASRGVMNVTTSWTGTPSTDPNSSTQIFQTNNRDKYDQIYVGPVDASTDSFRPSITLTPISDQSTVVAARVRFRLISSTGGLNGLFEFDPDVAVVDVDFTNSAVNNIGTSLNPGASITSLVTHDQAIYAAGNFNDTVFENIMLFSDNNASSLPGQGLNAPVAALYSLGDLLYVGGNFSNTSQGNVAGLSNIAAFSYDQNKWIALGAGLNGPVENIVPLQINTTDDQPETCVSFSGTFTQIRASGEVPASDVPCFAIWVPSRNDWLQNLDVSRMALTGKLTAFAEIPNGARLLAGTLKSAGMDNSGAVGLQSADDRVRLTSLPIKFQQFSTPASLSKRALETDQNVTGVVTGLYYDREDRNVTVYAGHFTASATDGSTVNNLLFLNGSGDDAVTGLPSKLDPNSTFFALETVKDLLLAGGKVSGQIGDSRVNGLIVYDLALASYAMHPPALQGDDVVVTSIKTRPTTTEVYVGGHFDTAGTLGCRSLCMYDTSSQQWNGIGTALKGTVHSLVWASNDKLVVAGNLTVSGNDTALATYEADTLTWTAVSIPQLPGRITAFAPATMDVSKWWAAGRDGGGSMFLGHYDGEKYHAIDNDFGSDTMVRGLQILGLSEDHESSDVLDDDQSLLITGRIDLPDFGSASAVLFDGTDITPFILTKTADGQAGSLSRLVSSEVNQLKGSGSRQPNGIAVLVAFCAALGATFLVVLIGFIINRLQRHRAGYTPISKNTDKSTNFNRVPPESLFGSLSQRNAHDAAPHI